MKRIWVCLALMAGILLLTGYSTRRVRLFADQLSFQLETAAEALHQDDVPTARQAIRQGARLCGQMRRESVLYLRTGDFIELEASLQAAGSHLDEWAQEEALGELGRASVQVENIDWLTRRWL